MIPYIAILVVLPFGPTLCALNLDVGIFFVMAMSSVSVIGVLMAGWASANKFSLIGALRAAAQLIAYELPLVLAAAAVVMQAGTLSLVGIVEAQQDLWFVIPQFIGFFIFMMAALAELTRPPFDMPIADSEIIFGAYTEYTGLKFAFFLLAEYGGIVALSGDRGRAVPGRLPRRCPACRCPTGCGCSARSSRSRSSSSGCGPRTRACARTSCSASRGWR